MENTTRHSWRTSPGTVIAAAHHYHYAAGHLTVPVIIAVVLAVIAAGLLRWRS
jgi:hypothetical protein